MTGDRNDLEHADCAHCGGIAYAIGLVTGEVALACSRCGASSEIRRRTVPPLPEL